MSSRVIPRRERRFAFSTVLLWVMYALLSSYGSATAHASQPPEPHTCKVSQLTALQDRNEADQIDGGLGHHAITITLRNESPESCVLKGIPKITLSYSQSDRLYALKTCANCPDYLFPVQSVAPTILRPKGSAYVVLGYDTNDGEGGCTEADPRFGPRFQYSTMKLRLYLPGETQPLAIPFKEWRSCGPLNITPFLQDPPKDGALRSIDR